MRSEFRNRVFLPIVVPLGILAFVAGAVGLFAWMLLYNTHEAALALATVLAAGILLTVSLAASRDRLDAGRKAVVVGAGILPLLIGVGYASGLVGDVDPALLNINRKPEETAPPWAPVVVAQSATEFVVSEVVVPPEPPEGEQLVVVFNNEDDIQHNLTLFTEEGGDVIAETENFSGPGAERSIAFEPLDPGDYFYQCTLHPPMVGTLTVEEGAEPSPTAPAA